MAVGPLRGASEESLPFPNLSFLSSRMSANIVFLWPLRMLPPSKN